MSRTRWSIALGASAGAAVAKRAWWSMDPRSSPLFPPSDAMGRSIAWTGGCPGERCSGIMRRMPQPQQRRAKIVCTLGPASSDPEMISALIGAGMNVARLNMSHGTQEDHTRVFEAIRQAAAAQGVAVAVLADLQGPKIRIGKIPGQGFDLKADGETATEVKFMAKKKKYKLV